MHITKPCSTKLIYSVSLNYCKYYIAKSPGINDGEQLDTNAVLPESVLLQICSVLSEIELHHTRHQSIELFNLEIFNILGRIRNPSLDT